MTYDGAFELSIRCKLEITHFYPFFKKILNQDGYLKFRTNAEFNLELGTVRCDYKVGFLSKSTAAGLQTLLQLLSTFSRIPENLL